MTITKLKIHNLCNNEHGYVIPACLLVLVVITIIGVMSVRTSNTDIAISTNTQIHKRSFYAAEAARAYVRNHRDLYGPANITPGTPVAFPEADNPSATEAILTGELEAFNGQVEYLIPGVPPRGSGFQAGKFKAHYYRMICRGHGPRDARATIESGFYRIGF